MDSIGNIFKITSFGESHGAVVGCIISGFPAGVSIHIEEIQEAVNKRKTNQYEYSSSRHEEDIVEILSGLFEGKTLGTPIAIQIKNKNAQAQDYEELKNIYRPNHADYTTAMKYGHRDYRGGGRSSIRVTAPIVAAGDIARQFLQQLISLQVIVYVNQIGNVQIENKYDYTIFEKKNFEIKNNLNCVDDAIAEKMLLELEKVKQQGDTLGGEITCIIKNCPAGLGEPLFDKFQSIIAKAMFTINTVKSLEFGAGRKSIAMKGSEMNDEFNIINKQIVTKTNHSGGIQGGISNGQDIYFFVGFKPISSIQQVQQTVNDKLQETTIQIAGRHDVCAVPRAVSIVSAYTYLSLADMYFMNLPNVK